MSVRSFMNDYLKDFARITLVDENGYIIYYGDVISCCIEITRGLDVESISGLGDEHDIIIVCKKRG